MAQVELTLEHVRDDVIVTETPSGHEITFDSVPEPGGEGPTPVEMLLASIGACSLIDVAMILKKKRLEPEAVRVRVEGTRAQDHPRRFTDVQLVYEVEGDVPEAALRRACELSVEKYCSVLATVQQAPKVGWSAQVL